MRIAVSIDVRSWLRFVPAVVLAIPSLVGLVDLWCWVAFGAQLSPLEWTAGRAQVAAIVFPILAYGALAIAWLWPRKQGGSE